MIKVKVKVFMVIVLCFLNFSREATCSQHFICSQCVLISLIRWKDFSMQRH